MKSLDHWSGDGGVERAKAWTRREAYERALLLELIARGHSVEQQKKFDVYYRGQLIGVLVPDLIADDLVIADPKVVTSLTDTHLAQMVGYLSITNLQLAILLNFKYSQLHWKRVVREANQEL